MQLSGKQRSCVACGQVLPKGSKLTSYRASGAEAVREGWRRQDNGDGTVTVDMCLQCQITRAKTASTNG